MLNYYAILGAHKGMESEEMALLYRDLAKKKHPDAGGSVTEFQLLNDARHHLCTSARVMYDKNLVRELHCTSCAGQGFKRKQFSFEESATITCGTCKGAGAII